MSLVPTYSAGWLKRMRPTGKGGLLNKRLLSLNPDLQQQKNEVLIIKPLH